MTLIISKNSDNTICTPLSYINGDISENISLKQKFQMYYVKNRHNFFFNSSCYTKSTIRHLPIFIFNIYSFITRLYLFLSIKNSIPKCEIILIRNCNVYQYNRLIEVY